MALALRPARPRFTGAIRFIEIWPWRESDACGSGGSRKSGHRPHGHPRPVMVARVTVRRVGSKKQTTHWVCADHLPQYVLEILASVASALDAVARSPRPVK